MLGISHSSLCDLHCEANAGLRLGRAAKSRGCEVDVDAPTQPLLPNDCLCNSIFSATIIALQRQLHVWVGSHRATQKPKP